jgi:enoyl-CoA hydratase/carnithine racemase
MIITSVNEGIAIIEFSDGRLLSRRDAEEGRALTQALWDCADSDEVRAIVLSAAGPDFCPGIDDPESVVHRDSADQQAVYAGATGLYQGLCYCKKVVVAAIQGACTGAGSALVLCADLAVAGSDAGITSPFDCVPEANFALATLTMRLNRAKAWLLTGDAMSASEALSVGLVNRVVPGDQVRDEALKMARAAARMPMDGMAISKVMMETYLDAQSVGREFDQARFHAMAMSGDTGGSSR